MNIFDFVIQYWPRLLAGTGMTVAQFFLAAILGVAIALLMGPDETFLQQVASWFRGHLHRDLSRHLTLGAALLDLFRPAPVWRVD